VPIPVSTSPHGPAFAVRVVPRAGRTSVAGTRGDALLVRLAAAPVEGAANEALIAALAGLFGRPKRDIVLLSGQASRDKRVAVAGMSVAAVTARLSDILQESGD
jgi:uncharacterized protein (TIGR00251 family)